MVHRNSPKMSFWIVFESLFILAFIPSCCTELYNCVSEWSPWQKIVLDTLLVHICALPESADITKDRQTHNYLGSYCTVCQTLYQIIQNKCLVFLCQKVSSHYHVKSYRSKSQVYKEFINPHCILFFYFYCTLDDHVFFLFVFFCLCVL